MWQEYELTLHAAMDLRDDTYDDLSTLKKMIAQIRDEIRKLGDVNVNAIEDYKEISERYQFLKTQHDDLIEAEKTLIGIIEELDTGMRKQFMEKFAEIQKQFDTVFKEMFGGGKGTLELVEDEDILECGIRIIAQPPWKETAEYDADVRWRKVPDGDFTVVRHPELKAVPVLSARRDRGGTG